MNSPIQNDAGGQISGDVSRLAAKAAEAETQLMKDQPTDASMADQIKAKVAEFAPAGYEIGEATDDLLDQVEASNEIAVFQFKVRDARYIRAFPSMNIVQLGHWMNIDGRNRIIKCLGKGCVLCQVKRMEYTRFIPGIDLVTLECGYLRATTDAVIGLDGRVRAVKKDTTFYGRLAVMAPASMAVVNLQITKTTEASFSVVAKAIEDGPTPEYIARFHNRLYSEAEQILSTLIDIYTDEQLRTMPVIQRLLKLKGM